MGDKVSYIVYRKYYECPKWEQCAVTCTYESADERAMSFLKHDKKVESVKVVKATTTYEDIGEWGND